MQIEVTFDSYEEMEAFARDVLGKAEKLTKKELNETAQTTAEIINRAEAKEEAQEKAKKAETKKSAPVEEKAEEKATENAEHTPADLKSLLTKKLKDGKKDGVRALFDEYEVANLTELLKNHADKIDEIYEKAEVI